MHYEIKNQTNRKMLSKHFSSSNICKKVNTQLFLKNKGGLHWSIVRSSKSISIKEKNESGKTSLKSKFAFHHISSHIPKPYLYKNCTKSK